MRIGELLGVIITFYEGLIILRALVSWLTAPDSTHPVVEWLKKITDPVLEPVRSVLPATGGVDLSPLIVLIGLELVKRILI